ncbi:MAG: sugar phosphate nucleotidyltransferase [Oscillospiraceae bacterium]
METTELFVPGRLCLFGEHTDWAGRYTDINSDVIPGLAIVTGIDLGIYANARKNDIFSIISLNEKGETVSFSCEMDLKTLREKAAEQQYFCYACGVAAYILEHYQIGGISIRVDKVTLPIKKGLSSSAAICVLVARAFNEVYQLKMSVNGEMQAAYRGEMLTKSRCGRLDQACAYGVNPVCMEFAGDDIFVEKLKVGRNLYWVFADLKAKKDTKKILSDLNKAFPFPQTETDRNIHEALGVDNHRIIAEASKAIADGNAEKIGQLMKEAQQLFDTKVAPGCPEELTAPKLHSILNDEKIAEYTYGGKGVGSQGDGTVQFIAKDKVSQQKLVEYLNSIGLEAYAFTLPASDRVRKAIIPVAGFGTRMYPETRFVKKEFLPVIDKNGIAKPVIMCLLEELDEAGIEEIILVVGKEEIPQFEEMFGKPLSDEHIEKLPERVREYEQKIARIGKKIRYAVQEERRGFGHAVYQTKKYLENEPVLLMLGDFVYRSNLNMTCATQTIKAYRKSGGQLTVAIKPVELDNVIHYGILTGAFDGGRSYMMDVTEMAEKPTVQYAKDFLGVKTTSGEEKYYCTFGQYVLTPDVFKYLEEDIEKHDKDGDTSEIQLTSALCRVLKEKGMSGVLVDGESFDVGIPTAYAETVSTFGK